MTKDTAIRVPVTHTPPPPAVAGRSIIPLNQSGLSRPQYWITEMNRPVTLKGLFRGTDIQLAKREGELLMRIIDAGDEGVTSLELNDAEFLGTAVAISRLRKLPITIDTHFVPVIDDNGELRKRVAKYIYRGCHRHYRLLLPSTFAGSRSRTKPNELAAHSLFRVFYEKLQRRFKSSIETRSPGRRQANPGLRKDSHPNQLGSASHD